MSGTRTHASGRISSGKWTFCTSARFVRTQPAVSVKTAEQKAHGTRLSIENTGYGKPLGWKLRELPEDDREHHHREKRLEHGPGDADQRLLVAHLDVAPGEDERKVAGPPERPEVREAAAPCGTDDREGCVALDRGHQCSEQRPCERESGGGPRRDEFTMVPGTSVGSSACANRAGDATPGQGALQPRERTLDLLGARGQTHP